MSREPAGGSPNERQPIRDPCGDLGPLVDERTIHPGRVRGGRPEQGDPVLHRTSDLEQRRRQLSAGSGGFADSTQAHLVARQDAAGQAPPSASVVNTLPGIGGVEEVRDTLCIFLYRPDFSASSLAAWSASIVSAAAPSGFLGVNRPAPAS